MTDKGWAHAVAHTADLLDEVAVHPDCRASWLEPMLQAITQKVAAERVWLFGEEDRLVYAAAHMLERGLLSDQTISGILEGLVNRVSQHVVSAVPRHNVKDFLRSLYLQILKLQADSKNLGLVLAALEPFS